ncbi:PQ loop repeat-domain-containing protein [Phyllosticta citrichinensis]|uniref:PQ loop repeat-domain-containing protein n=1 Tax=Phyllosticta citrichinensis TaxID=1130410 RepID=A0ABR1XMU8_9PEZI
MATDLTLMAQALSRVLGWTYFLCWSLSFYPQPILNWRRRSTRGFGIDFPTLNVLGFAAYTLSTGAMLFSPTIRAQYAYRYPSAPESTVRVNDFVFALHAAIVCIIIYTQFWVWGFEVDKDQKISRTSLGIFWGNLLGVTVIVFLVLTRGKDGGNDPGGWAWIDTIYALGYVKLVVTIVKYIPQVWINYKRKSTVGWSIDTILLDISGGILSNLQLFIDSALEGDWTGITGNPVKFGLGNVSILFDVIFLIQHYALYRNATKVVEIQGRDERDGEHRPLLEDGRSSGSPNDSQV